jgi:hypothetical protein
MATQDGIMTKYASERRPELIRPRQLSPFNPRARSKISPPISQVWEAVNRSPRELPAVSQTRQRLPWNQALESPRSTEERSTRRHRWALSLLQRIETRQTFEMGGKGLPNLRTAVVVAGG